MTLNNMKISLRTDDLSNWTSADPVLRRGELAVVNDISAGIVRLKIGNGLSSFTSLDFINDPKIITQLLDANGVKAKYIEQGAHVQASPFALAAGMHLTAASNFSQALGFNAQAVAGDDYSFVWNGDDTRLLVDEYQTHGRGTFNISPLSGLSGIYIGEVTLADILSANAQSVASSLTAYYTKDETSSASEISNALDTKADLTAVPTKTSDLSNDSEFTTSSWVIEQNYISSIPDTYALKDGINLDYVSSSKAIYLSAGSHVTSVDCTDFIKDGMLSTAELCGTTLVLTFNADAGFDPISVEMSSFVDNYDGKISDLSGVVSSLSDAVNERAMLSDIPLSASQLVNDEGYIVLSDIPDDLSSFTNSPLYVTSSEVSSKLEEIDKKVFIDDRISGIHEYSDLSIIKLSAYEYDQLVDHDETLSNALYIIEDEFEDAYGQQIKNLAPGTDLSDAVNLEQLSSALSDVDIPDDLSAFANSPGYLTGLSVSIDYNSASRKIVLSAGSNVTSVDCTDFIKDGMLSNVELCAGQLIFNFNTDSGVDPISVFLSNFIDETQYWKKSETSSSAEISTALLEKAGVTDIDALSTAIDQKSSVIFVDWEED